MTHGLNNFEKSIDNMEDLIEGYYENQINDPSIELRCMSPAGESLFHIYLDSRLAIFKNGILYDIRNISNIGIPVINVPNNLAENELKNYISNLISEINSETVQNLIIEDIEKGTKDSLGFDVPNGYTLFCNLNGDKIESYIIVNKNTIVHLEDNVTNIKLNSSSDIIPSDTILEVKEIENGKAYSIVADALKNVSDKFVVYDITLKSEGVKIQPNGKVEISIPIPSEYDTNKIVVYRVEDDGTKVKYNAKINNNYATIQTDHFSKYVLVEENNSNMSETNDNTTQGAEKDETPKTGVVQYVNIAGIVIIISSVAIFIFKK